MDGDLRIHNAIIFAAVKHQNQKRKGTDIPYIVHPMEVMQILTDMGCAENVIIAGILHDTLEDTDTKPEEIEAEFGKEVLDIVKTESENKTKTWKERKQHTIDKVKNDSLESKLVCFADKFSNIRSMYADLQEKGAELWKRFNAPKSDIEWYYRSIAGALKETELAKETVGNGNRAFELFREFEKTIDRVFNS